MNALSRFIRCLVLFAAGIHLVPTLRAQVPDGSPDPAFTAGVTSAGAVINAIAEQPDGRVIFAGQFATTAIARLDPNGAIDGSFTASVGSQQIIRAVALQPDGKIIIAGDFVTVNGQQRGRIARLFPTGELDPTFQAAPAVGANGPIHCIAVQGDGKIVVGGDFTAINGQARTRLARLNADGSVESDTTFRSANGITNGPVFSLALQPDGKILVGGAFTVLADQQRNRLARLLPDGSVEGNAGFAIGAGADQPVRAIALQSNGKIVIGGAFSNFNGALRGRIARLHANGGLESTDTFNSSVNGTVQALAIQRDGKILLGGAFGSVNGAARSCIARLKPDGSVESAADFNPNGTNGPVQCLSLQRDGKILIGGSFTAVAGQTRNRLARLTNTGRSIDPVHELMVGFRQAPKRPTRGALVAGPDGYYWGTTETGGYGHGTIYKVKPDGTDWRTVISFTQDGAKNRGRNPVGGLTSDGAGNFWGTTIEGGVLNEGTVFKVNATTGELTTIVEFSWDGPINRGAFPAGTLMKDEAGIVWGTTNGGGIGGSGTVFKIDPATGIFTTVIDFTGMGTLVPGAAPNAGLVSDGRGFLWGTTSYGGAYNTGTLFKVNRNTGELTTVYHFSDFGFPIHSLCLRGPDELWGAAGNSLFKVNLDTQIVTRLLQSSNAVRSGLINGGDGFLWFVTDDAGSGSDGGILKLNPQTGVVTLAYNFTGNNDTGRRPEAPLVWDGAGSFIGTTNRGGRTGFGTVFKFHSASGTLTTISNFTDEVAPTKGEFPYCGLVSDGAGFLWGTTQHGGKGDGTIFKVDEVTGELFTVVEFEKNGPENLGEEPRAMLVPDGQGNLWGTTSEPLGTIFKVNTSSGKLTTVYQFVYAQDVSLGIRPNAELINDGAGFFWGTTLYGGAVYGGSVFKVNISTGVVSTVFDRFETIGGYSPYAALTSDAAGNFWGTTNGSDVTDSGTIFKLNKATGATTRVALLTGLNPPFLGTEPRSRLFDDGVGTFWGITSEGGLLGGDRGLGTIFRIDPVTGAFKNVVQFTGVSGAKKGSEPRAQLIADDAGILWGTTWKGGAYDHGTIYKLNGATNEFTTVMEFTGSGDQAKSGSLPGYGSLLRHTDGNLYGVTQDGGPDGGGTVFRLRFGPTPMTLPADAILSDRATLRGTVNPNGNPTTVAFEIGTDSRLVGATRWEVLPTQDERTVLLRELTVSSLQPSTTYYFRLVGENAGNAVSQRGAIRSFVTPANVAPVVTLAGDSPLTLEATLDPYVDPGATAQDVENGTLIPTITANNVESKTPGIYSVTWTATDQRNLSGNAIRTVRVVDTTAPTITVSDLVLTTFDPTGLVVNYTPAMTSDVVGVTQVQYSHPSGTKFPRGRTVVTVTANDAAGNESTADFTIDVVLGATVHQQIAFVGTAVPGAGTDPRIPAGAKWSFIGVPAVSSSGKIAFVGDWKSTPAASPTRGLFLDGTLLARVGRDAPLPGVTFQTFQHPVFARDSDKLFAPAVLAGRGVTEDNNAALVSFDPAAKIVARENDLITTGPKRRIASFLGVEAVGGRAMLLGTLREAVPPNRTALIFPGEGAHAALAYTGQKLFAKTVRSLHALQTISGSTGQGRAELSGSANRFIARFTDGTHAVVEMNAQGLPKKLAMSGESADGSASSEVWKSLGTTVGSTADSAKFVFLGKVVPSVGDSNGRQRVYIGSETGIEALVSTGDNAPEAGLGTFDSFQEPVLAADGSCLAFVGKTKVGMRLETGIFARIGDAPLATIATLTSPPPDVPEGARWKAFVSLAAPGGGVGPVFTATLRGSGITAANDKGLWAIDTHGLLRCLFREGDQVASKTLKSFDVLNAVAGTRGAARAFNERTQIVWRAVFADGSAGIIRTTVP